MNIYLVEIVYITGAFIALCAGASQLRQLLVTKASDELSLPTWLTWLGTQCTALLYTVSIGNTLMVIVNCAWITFYLFMVILIVRFRTRPLLKSVATSEEELDEVSL